jgi:hypothetical protein
MDQDLHEETLANFGALDYQAIVKCWLYEAWQLSIEYHYGIIMILMGIVVVIVIDCAVIFLLYFGFSNLINNNIPRPFPFRESQTVGGYKNPSYTFTYC